MCGVFGFISSSGRGPDITRLQRIAVVTQTRGEHAFGLAWLDLDGSPIRTFKRARPASESLSQLEACRDATAVLGHCRYATHGSPEDNRNNHPHPAGAGVFVHNGVIGNHEQLIHQHRLSVQTQCDSEVLGLLMIRCAGTVAQRAAWAANQTQGELAMLGIWRDPARLLLVRRGRPLYFGSDQRGFYFASLAPGLPGEVRPFTDNTAMVLALANGGLRRDGVPVTLPAARR